MNSTASVRSRAADFWLMRRVREDGIRARQVKCPCAAPSTATERARAALVQARISSASIENQMASRRVIPTGHAGSRAFGRTVHLTVPRGCGVSTHIFDDAACEFVPASSMGNGIKTGCSSVLLSVWTGVHLWTMDEIRVEAYDSARHWQSSPRHQAGCNLG